MRIDKELPQSYFRNHRHKALVNILFTANWMLERLKDFLEAEGITHQQYNILRILNNSQIPLSTLQIRDQMLDKMSDTSRIVERLLKKELVNKKICPNDKRLVDVTIAAKGIELLSRLDKSNDKLDGITHKLSDADTDLLNKLLDRVREKDSQDLD